MPSCSGRQGCSRFACHVDAAWTALSPGPSYALVLMRVLRAGVRRTVRGGICALCTQTVGSGFARLGISPLLLPALGRLGISEPTPIQSLAAPALAAGGDAVLLDETGSGKTLAYALPIVSSMLDAASADADAGAGAPAASVPQALVLVPNRELCGQVVGVMHELLADVPLRASALTEADADADADLLVSTPAVALRDWRGPARVRWMVLDEADSLLAGSFKPATRSQYPVEQLAAELKRSAKRDHLKIAAGPDAGARRDVGALRAWRAVKRARDDDALEGAKAQLAAARAATWARVQFVLVAATMPNAGERNIDAHVKRQWPTAAWVRTGREHREKAALRQYFVRVDEEGRADALRHAIVHGPAGRALVFANTIASAERAHAELSLVRRCGLFHKNVPGAERRELVRDFQEGSLPVLVCTGLGSRGLDFRDVSHVVQYEVATNSVEFMHRVGRTARAGRSGVATNIYDDNAADLVDALRAAYADGLPIDATFSRKRLFRKRVRRGESRAATREQRAAAEDG